MLGKKKSQVTYSYRTSHSLVGMQVQPFKTQHYTNGIRITHTLENKLLFFNARQHEDRVKFLEDLKESILESDEMEALRIEAALEHQQKWCLLPSVYHHHHHHPAVLMSTSTSSSASGQVVATPPSRSHTLGRTKSSGAGQEDSPDVGTPTGSHHRHHQPSPAPLQTSMNRDSGLCSDISGSSTEEAGIAGAAGQPSGAKSAGTSRKASGTPATGSGAAPGAGVRQRPPSVNSLDSGMSSTASTASRESTAQELVPQQQATPGNNSNSDQQQPQSHSISKSTVSPNDVLIEQPMAEQEAAKSPASNGFRRTASGSTSKK